MLPSFFALIDSQGVFLLESCIHSLTHLLNDALARSLSRLIVCLFTHLFIALRPE